MEIRHFLSFKAIVEHGSFIKAAQQLNYAQSSITSHIQAIEEYYEQPVFDRIGKKVVLNAFGTQVYQQCLPLLSAYDDICKLKEDSLIPCGTLRLGVPESTMLYRLSPIVQRYKKHYPNVNVILQNTLCPIMRQSLKDGELDLAILLDRENRDAELVAKKLFVEPMSIILPPDYPHQTLSSSDGHAILFTEQGCSYRKIFSDLLKEKGIRSANTIETASVEVIKHYVLCSIGISFLPTIVIQKELDEGTIKHIPWQSDDPINIQLVHHKSKWLTPAMKSFIHFLELESARW